MENVNEAQRRFSNIKKRFNKRRKDSKGPSGSGSNDIREARDKFKDMDYLAWLEPYTKLRQTKSNLTFKALLEEKDFTSDEDRVASSWKILENPRKSWKKRLVLESPGKTCIIWLSPGKSWKNEIS